MASKKNSKSNENLVISDPEFPGFRVVGKRRRLGVRWFAQKRWMGIWWNVGLGSILGYFSSDEAQWVMYKEARHD